MTKLSAILSFVAFFAFVACSQTNSEFDFSKVTDGEIVNTRVSQEVFKQALSDENAHMNGQLIDVRTPEEYAAGTIGNAKNIDFFANDFKDKMMSLDKDRPVYIFCKSGGRSGKTLKMMKEWGFTYVLELEGGYSGYSN